MGQADASRSSRSGEIAATILIAGKPAGAMAKLQGSARFSLLAGRLRQAAAGRLSAGDARSRRIIPAWSARGDDVETIAVSAVLICYNWPKDAAIAIGASPNSSTVLSATGRIPETAASSEMARDQSCGGAAGLDQVSGRDGMA